VSAVPAVLYLRSSKDRSDVSIDAQRRELTALASQRGLLVVGEYTDVVESGSDANRPGLTKLASAMRQRPRPWSTVLLLDTSRLARKSIIAVLFERDAERNGVRVVYKSILTMIRSPDNSSNRVFRALDEYHSLISKAKGLAGMKENVRQGYRAGGRAPRGYRLVTIRTSAVRDGSEVVKSRLEPNDDASLVSEYLKLRAEGTNRASLARRLKLPWPLTSLNGMEWNALTYAGHTVWNVHNEQTSEGCKDGEKRRACEEWVIQRNTHDALISDAVAEALLAQLESLGTGNTRDRAPAFLLSGLLRAPNGERWYGKRTSTAEFYRVKTADGSRNLPAGKVDTIVVDAVANDLASSDWALRAFKATQAMFAASHAEEIASAKVEIAALEARASKMMDMAAALESPAPVLRKVDEIERERIAVEQRVVAWELEVTRPRARSRMSLKRRFASACGAWPRRCAHTHAARCAIF
jgi:site-specific DNA recombinase